MIVFFLQIGVLERNAIRSSNGSLTFPQDFPDTFQNLSDKSESSILWQPKEKANKKLCDSLNRIKIKQIEIIKSIYNGPFNIVRDISQLHEYLTSDNTYSNSKLSNNIYAYSIVIYYYV